MEINWFQIVAQMVNFFILLFLLNKLFYKPVGAAMQARQELLASQQADAEQMKIKAEEQAAELSSKLSQIEETKAGILAKTREEAREQYEQLMEKYRGEADARGTELHKQFERDQETFLREVRFTIGEAAVRLASTILKSLSGEDLERRVFDLFVKRIGEITPADLDGESPGSEDQATVVSHAALLPDEREELEDSLAKALGYLPRLSYQVDEGLGLGYELSFATLLVQKNMARYLEEVSRELREELGRKS
jgi:F-type H+-transporting ATPase subunit b